MKYLVFTELYNPKGTADFVEAGKISFPLELLKNCVVIEDRGHYKIQLVTATIPPLTCPQWFVKESPLDLLKKE